MVVLAGLVLSLVLAALCSTEAVLGFALGAGCGRCAGPALPPAASPGGAPAPGRCPCASLSVSLPGVAPWPVLSSLCSSYWWLEPSSPCPTQLQAVPAPFLVLGDALTLQAKQSLCCKHLPSRPSGCTKAPAHPSSLVENPDRAPEGGSCSQGIEIQGCRQ